VIQDEMTRADIQESLGLKHLPHLRDTYLRPALEGGWVEMTLPNKPRSSLQKYRLTPAGKVLLANRHRKADGTLDRPHPGRAHAGRRL